MNPRPWLTLVVLVSVGAFRLGAAQKDAPGVPKVVKLTELIAGIKAEKGKVVVVDFWADT